VNQQSSGRAVDDAPTGVARGERHFNPVWTRLARVAVLAVGDLVALFGSGALAYLAWARPVRGQAAEMYINLVPLLGLFLAGYLVADLYPGFGIGPVEALRRCSYVTGFGFLVLASISFAIKLPHMYSRLTFGIAFLLGLVLVPAVRSLVLTVVRRFAWWQEPVVVVGSPEEALETLQSLAGVDQRDFRAVAVLDPDVRPVERGALVGGVPLVSGLASAARLADQGVQVAVLALDVFPSEEILDLVQRHFYRVVSFSDYDHLPAEVTQVRNLGGLLTLEYTSNLLLPHNRMLKRSLDVLASAVGLVLALPVIGVSALLVRLTSRGGSFYSQERAGLDGGSVAVFKIRTMCVDAEQRLEAHLDRHPELREEWERSFKLRDDPRLVPLFGRVLRRFSLDELPQLWNVLKGDMSLVGPRPLPEYHLSSFPDEFREMRQRMRPGITGLWQVTVRSEGGVEDQQSFDTYYLRNWSVWLDIFVLGRTLGAVLSGRGAY
jgi:Undecaprenyl-phosphate galactose phosphotransferase WbaP